MKLVLSSKTEGSCQEIKQDEVVEKIKQILKEKEIIKIEVVYKNKLTQTKSQNNSAKGLKILSDEYQRVIVEKEDTKEILAEITNDDIKSANNIQVRIKPTYD